MDPSSGVVSILIFGGRGAVLPLVIGVTTVIGTFPVLMGVNQLYDLSIFALNLVIGLGLGLAVDYALFLLNRYREELVLSPLTVKTHVSQVLSKLGARDRAQLVVIAYEGDLVGRA